MYDAFIDLNTSVFGNGYNSKTRRNRDEYYFKQSILENKEEINLSNSILFALDLQNSDHVTYDDSQSDINVIKITCVLLGKLWCWWYHCLVLLLYVFILTLD